MDLEKIKYKGGFPKVYTLGAGIMRHYVARVSIIASCIVLVELRS